MSDLCPLHHSTDILSSGIRMLFLLPFLLELLAMFPVVVRRKLSYCTWNAHRRPALVGRRGGDCSRYRFYPVRVGLAERPCRLASDRSTGMYKSKLRAVLDRTKLRRS